MSVIMVGLHGHRRRRATLSMLQDELHHQAHQRRLRLPRQLAPRRRAADIVCRAAAEQVHLMRTEPPLALIRIRGNCLANCTVIMFTAALDAG